MRQIDYIVIHCSATRPDQDIDVDDIRRMHVQGNGWSDIGYHYVITRDGRVQQGRHESVSGAHVRGYNKNSIGVCMCGGVDASNNPDSNFTKAQLDAVWDLVSELKARYPRAEIRGHRSFPGVHKACPSFNCEEFFRDL